MHYKDKLKDWSTYNEAKATSRLHARNGGRQTTSATAGSSKQQSQTRESPAWGSAAPTSVCRTLLKKSPQCESKSSCRVDYLSSTTPSTPTACSRGLRSLSGWSTNTLPGVQQYGRRVGRDSSPHYRPRFPWANGTANDAMQWNARRMIGDSGTD